MTNTKPKKSHLWLDYLARIDNGSRPRSDSVIANQLIKEGLAEIKYKTPILRYLRPPVEGKPAPYIVITAEGKELLNERVK